MPRRSMVRPSAGSTATQRCSSSAMLLPMSRPYAPVSSLLSHTSRTCGATHRHRASQWCGATGDVTLNSQHFLISCWATAAAAAGCCCCQSANQRVCCCWLHSHRNGPGPVAAAGTLLTTSCCHNILLSKHAYQWVCSCCRHPFHDGLRPVAAQVAPRVLGLAVGARAQAAGGQWHDLHVTVLAHLQQHVDICGALCMVVLEP